MTDIIIGERKSKLILIAAIFSIFMVFPILLIYDLLSQAVIGRSNILGVIGISFFLLCGLAVVVNCIHRLTGKKRYLVLSEKGITEKNTTLCFGFVEWNKIESVELKKIGIEFVIAFHFKDEIGILEKTSKREKAFLEKQASRGIPMFFLKTGMLNEKAEKVVELINNKIRGVQGL